MKIVLSRKGFDSSSGGGPSPIHEGRPLSLPIPAGQGASRTTYGDLGLGEHAAAASGGRFGPDDPCHHDPMFRADGTCLFGQAGAAQTHLANQRVGAGDLFVFFGLFRGSGEPAHHRLFGYLLAEEAVALATCGPARLSALREIGHPHALAGGCGNDVIYRGPGAAASTAHRGLRLSVDGGPASLWQVPAFLHRTGLSYHGRADRWLPGGRLRAVSRGQEFVADIGADREAREWVRRVCALIDGR